MDTGVIEAAIKQAVNWFKRRFSPSSIDPDELIQQGWSVALAALQNYQPDKGPLGGYLFTAVRRQLGNHITQAGCPVSIHGDWENRRGQFKAASIEAAIELATPEPNPEQSQLAQDRLIAAALWQSRFDAAIDSMLVQVGPIVGEAFCRRYGINYYTVGTAREIALAMGIPVRRVYAMLAKAHRLAFTNMALYQVNRTLKEVAPHGIEEACDTSAY